MAQQPAIMSNRPFKPPGVQGLITFETEDHQPFRTLYKDGEPWFVVADVCKALGINNPTDAVKSLDTDDLDSSEVIDAMGRKQQARITNESGLYQFIFQSRKAEAKAFKRWITKEVLPSIRKTGGYGSRGGTPLFVRRFNLNWDRVDAGYFSIISELYVRVYGKLEQLGHVIPDKAPGGTEIRPDVSVGQLFPKWLSRHPEALQHVGRRKKYTHIFENGLEVEAWQYENSVLPVFIEFIEKEWLPNRSFDYFRQRDQQALEYIPLALLPAPPTRENRKRSA